MFKAPIIISLVMLSVIIATLSNGIIAAVSSLFAFSLLFYFVSTQKNNKAPRD
jgi:predicted membrane protein